MCRTINIFLRDGLLYFLVILIANLLNTLLFFVSFLSKLILFHHGAFTNYPQLAVDDLKGIGASFSQLITATMISRLVLNLRLPVENSSEGMSTPSLPIKFLTRTIESLGGDMEPAFTQSFCDQEEIPPTVTHHSYGERSIL